MGVGTVTQYTGREDIVPLGNIEVLVYEAGNEMPVGYATTNAGGEYTIAGLAPGAYTVEFSPTPESGLNFVTPARARAHTQSRPPIKTPAWRARSPRPTRTAA